MKRKEPVVDTKKLSKKHQTDVNKVITLWKKGKNDLEIASSYGIELTKLQDIRSEIEQAHQRARYELARENWLQV